MLQLAKQARLDLQRIMGDVSDVDFSEPGDKLELDRPWRLVFLAYERGSENRIIYKEVL